LNNYPFFSVIISTYSMKHLDKSIKSLLTQTYKNFEIILVNDNPSNKDKIDELFLNEKKIKIIHNKTNIGLTKSLNKAFQFSQGDIIVRQDDDDISFDYRFEYLVKEFNKKPRADIIGSYTILKKNLTDGTGLVIKSPLTHNDILKQLLKTNCLQHPSIAMKREVLLAFNGYNETYRYAQDYDLFLRAALMNYKFKVIPKPLVIRLYGKNNITTLKRKSQLLYAISAQCHYLAKQEKHQLNHYIAVFLNVARLFIPNIFRQFYACFKLF